MSNRRIDFVLTVDGEVMNRPSWKRDAEKELFNNLVYAYHDYMEFAQLTNPGLLERSWDASEVTLSINSVKETVDV